MTDSPTPSHQFVKGCIDGLRIPKGIATIFKYSNVKRLSSLCFLINGVLYLGVELLYQAFTGYFF
jgi:hypothetical protein